MAPDRDVMPEAAPASAAPPADDLLRVVGADEHVFRRVRYEKNEYAVENGKVRVSSTAFNESTGRPSVDRKVLREGGDPVPTQDGDPNSAVLVLAVAEIRAMDRIKMNDKRGKPIGEGHAFDVFADPLPAKDDKPANPAHAEIRGVPDFPEANVRKLREKLQIALQRMVNETPDAPGRWAIQVVELRSPSPPPA